jgi:tRNA threonylcarbamoyladenosine biosynthesis protein TsaB
VQILALETSTELCSAALWRDGEVLAREALAGQRHSELLLPMIDALLAEAGLKLTALDGIAFGAGPGSFTGLRIACGVTQGLAFGAGLPVTGVSTLEALAEGADPTVSHALCCFDARLGEIFHAAYVREAAGWREVSPPVLATPAIAPAVTGEHWTGLGSGFATHGAALAQHYGAQLAATRPDVLPHARAVATLGARAFARGEGVAAERALPLYVRDKVALTVAERAAR